MELFGLIKCEFIKNFSWKKVIIVGLVLILCCLLLIKFQDFFGTTREYSQELSITDFNSGYKMAKSEYEKDSNLINKGVLDVFKIMEGPYNNAYNLVGKEEKSVWQKNAVELLRLDAAEQVALEQLVNYYQDESIMKYLDNYKEDSFSVIYSDYKRNYIQQLRINYDKPLDELKQQLENITIKNNLIIQALEENSYYLRVQAGCLEYENTSNKSGMINSDTMKEYCKYFAKNKIKEETDYRSINAIQFQQLSYVPNFYKIPTREEYEKNSDRFQLPTYEIAKNFYTRMYNAVNNKKTIIDYAFRNNLKHDVILVEDDILQSYNSSKSYMNLGLHLGVVIMIIMSITNAGIVAKEHDKGTIKLLLTKPVSRTKVLLSKFLYLILDTYVWWIIGSIILFLLVGFKFGFNDLFTSKIIVSNGLATEVNYLLWYLKEMIICSVPVWCFLSILFSLSTITLSTALTASLTSIVSIFSITIWAMIANFGARFLTVLSYTPIPYLDYWFVRYSNNYYIRTISSTPLSDNYGLIISLVVSIVLFLITVLIYNKRDVKN